MKVCVYGLWHLGCVTAACIAEKGMVVGLDNDPAVLEGLQSGQAPLFEPGLNDLIKDGIKSGRLSFVADSAKALADARVIWVTYDTPVDEHDVADVDFVFTQITNIFQHLEDGTLVLISSQLPVGTTRRLAKAFAATRPDARVSFGYSPENLRLGTAIKVFKAADRIVIGLDPASGQFESDRSVLAELLMPFTDHIEWMSIESAEMVKHSLNAFLATSVAFINEIATICESVGADAQEVARGLKSESRIGPRAYLNPGGAFAGGTLARDISFLEKIAVEHHLSSELVTGVRSSNETHSKWIQRKLESVLGDLKNKKVAVLGLTYKPGTSTLRRSDSVRLCTWLTRHGALVTAHDPAIDVLPASIANQFLLADTAERALEEAAAVVIATCWPVYQNMHPDTIVSSMSTPVVIDPSRFLQNNLGSDNRVQYFSVGRC